MFVYVKLQLEVMEGLKVMAGKANILVDLDGVLNTYTGGFDENYIPPVKSGAAEFLTALSEKYIVKIFTTRNRLLASKWLIENGLDKYVADVTNIKEPAILHIDDRALTFEGNFVETLKKVEAFKVWYSTTNN